MTRDGFSSVAITFKAVSLVPNVYGTPMGVSMVPVPYPIVANLSDSVEAARTVRFNDDPVCLLSDSMVTHVTGNDAGTIELKQIDSFHVIARSAFSDLYACGERTGRSVTVAWPINTISAVPFHRNQFRSEKSKAI